MVFLKIEHQNNSGFVNFIAHLRLLPLFLLPFARTRSVLKKEFKMCRLGNHGYLLKK